MKNFGRAVLFAATISVVGSSGTMGYLSYKHSKISPEIQRTEALRSKIDGLNYLLKASERNQQLVLTNGAFNSVALESPELRDKLVKEYDRLQQEYNKLIGNKQVTAELDSLHRSRIFGDLAFLISGISTFALMIRYMRKGAVSPEDGGKENVDMQEISSGHAGRAVKQYHVFPLENRINDNIYGYLEDRILCEL